MTKQADRWKRVSRTVRERMKRIGIVDQAELIRRSKLSQPTAQQYMSGVGRSDTPRPAQRAMLAEALQWPTDWWERFDDEDVDLVNMPFTDDQRTDAGVDFAALAALPAQ